MFLFKVLLLFLVSFFNICVCVCLLKNAVILVSFVKSGIGKSDGMVDNTSMS